MVFYNLGHVTGAKGETGPKGDRGEKGDNSPLSNIINSNDTTTAVTGKAVALYISEIIGDIEEDMLE